MAIAQKPLGIDVSSFQGASVNWTSVKGSGVVFAWAKATEGTIAAGYHVDADFTINENNGKAAGVYMGAYHFAHPAVDTPAAEAAFFWTTAGPYIKADGKTFIPMLDMEVFTGVTGAASYSDWANQWCNIIVSNAAAAGVVTRPCIYVSACNAHYFDSTVAQWFNDIANYGSVNGNNNPQTGTPWTSCSSGNAWGGTNWNLWQYSSVGSVPGVSGNCDVDVYDGSLASLVSGYVATSTGPPPPPPPVITAQPTNLTIWQGSNATFSVTSTNAAHYQWAFNQTNIAGATISSYTVTNAIFTNGGGYSVAMTNTNGTTLSATAFLAVLPPLSNAPGSVVAPTGMVDWWPADGHPNDIFGTVHGIPAGGFFYAPGKSGKAFHFDGATGFISNNAANIPAPWTACMWVNYSHTPQPNGSAGLLEDGTYALKLEQYGSATHNVGISQLGYVDSTFNYTAPANTWVHLAFVTSSTSVTLYANGVSQGSITTNGFPLPRKYMGAGYVTSSAKYIDQMFGSLDEIMLFNRALSQSEISSIYNAGTAGLVRAPQVVSWQTNSNGQLLVNLEGLTGRIYTIHSSTDLLNWSLAGIMSNPLGTNQYVTSNNTNNPAKFYSFSQTY